MAKKIYIGPTQIAGLMGKSAYQSWLDAGNIGTENDFLNQLKGVGFQNVSSQQDGTVIITLTSGDTVTIDLNHDHPDKQNNITASGLLKGDGNGGVSAAIPGTDYQSPITVDTAPTSASTNPVQSGGVYTALSGKLSYVYLTDETDMPASPDANTLYLILES